MWIVEYEPQVAEEMKKDFAQGHITKEDIALIKAWIEEVREFGPEHIQQSRLWDDHPLEAEWKGHRSSCFSLKGRIIYRIEDKKIVVTVVRITGSHDYKKGRKK